MQNKDILATNIRDLLIPVENVACVQPFNNLEHALLVLIKSGYSAIPVLDTRSHVQGIISKTMILDAILGNERIEFEKLSESTVDQVMQKEVPCIRAQESLLRALELSINRPFLCVVEDGGELLGILTRRALLVLLYKFVRDQRA
ncbi:MAG: CBS domain-containing protein [Alicyclobacillus herbarius]|uniref:cyclic-di-AMP-binding protein CbpB n=1 Tax=Alicyclobacillus herbarius TaxID=122960 RepID=UPI00047ABF6E|nr:cyclic-di-AMP-binding protein CbpB [Alicyclobacillus herbarius]MCL6633067.1 CBS domain-containing protein [Alicyclobacillus herbarius]